MITKTWPCKGSGGCGGTYSAELTAESPADWTGDDWAAFMDAQSDHVAGHGSPGTDVHIRKQIARTRTRSTVNPLTDSADFRLGSDKNGSQTLCGDPATDRDMSYADGRCLELRPA